MVRIRVLVVDDSAFMRQMVSRLLSEDAEIEVAGTARDGIEALARVAELAPDVVTLDVEMPRLDGLGVLQRLMAETPVPVVMLSSLTQRGAETTIRALAGGAVDFVPKPSGSISLDIRKVQGELVGKVKLAARTRVRRRNGRPPQPPAPVARGLVPGALAADLVVIGCSTGGPGALHELLPRLPADWPLPLLVVQHMPSGFTRSLAERLDALSAIEVREARPGDELRPGVALVAPGGLHLDLDEQGRVRLDASPPRHGVRPSVDVTLEAAVRVFGGRVVAVILTGMGFDGAKGAGLVKMRGGRILVEAEESCVVFGMPRAVIEMGYADRIAPLERMHDELMRVVAR